jgi:hypothetical protein
MVFNGQYLSYNEYKALGGSLDMTPFNLLEFEARRKIDERTQNRLKKIEEIPEEVKMCMFALINNINSYTSENQVSKNISSESVGSYSVNYVTGAQIQEIIKSKNAELNDIVLTYLTGVIVNGEHVIYLGVN